jgi:hypothetical protein
MFFLFRDVPVSSVGFLQHHSEMSNTDSDVALLLHGQNVSIWNIHGTSKDCQSIIFQIQAENCTEFKKYLTAPCTVRQLYFAYTAHMNFQSIFTAQV